MSKLRILYTVFITVTAVFLAYMLTTHTWLQTDLTALLPQEQAQDILLQKADQANEAQLNGQVLLLVGSNDAGQAFQTASKIATLWKESEVFAAVDSVVAPDLNQIRASAEKLGLATLPQTERTQLMTDAVQYFRVRAQDAANPFAVASPLPLEQDWLGF